MLVPCSATRHVAKRGDISAFCVGTSDSGAIGVMVGAIRSFLLRTAHSRSTCAMDGRSSILSAVSSMDGAVSLLLTNVTTVSLLINNVNVVGVVLMSIARQAHRVNVEGTINTGEERVLFRFLYRSYVLSVLNNLVKLFLSFTVINMCGCITNDDTTVG